MILVAVVGIPPVAAVVVPVEEGVEEAQAWQAVALPLDARAVLEEASLGIPVVPVVLQQAKVEGGRFVREVSQQCPNRLSRGP